MSVHELDLAEDAPLLSPSERLVDDAGLESDHDGFDAIPSQPHIRARRWQVRSPRAVIVVASLIKFTVCMTGMMLVVPYYRLMEDMFCHVYYQDESLTLIEEMECKVDQVQSDLITLNGWMGLINSVIGLIIAFPYGTLADKIGRKPTFLFAYSGIALSFTFGPFLLATWQHRLRQSPYLLLMGSCFQLFGGGIHVMFATLYAIASDVSSEKDKASNFLYLTFGATAGGLLGPLVAALLMGTFGPWVPIVIVGIVTPFALAAIIILLPETMTATSKHHRNRGHDEPASIKEHIRQGFKELAQSLAMIKNINVPLVLVTFFVQNARFTAYVSIISQYISKHFGWRLSDTSLLLSPLGILNLAILAILPRLSKVLVSPRFRYSPFGKDLVLTRISTCILVVGAVIQGLSHNVVLFIFGIFISTFGAADSPLARATVSHYVAPEYTSRLHALIAMVEVAGSFIGGPVLAWTFKQGLKRRGIWIGLPWFYVGFLCFLSWAALWFVRPPKKDMREEATDGDVDELAPDDPLCSH